MGKAPLLIFLFSIFVEIASVGAISIHSQYSEICQFIDPSQPIPIEGLVSSTFEIKLDDFPNAYNPSIVETEEGFILTFRYLPEKKSNPLFSCIGAVLLNKSFQPVSQPEILNTSFNTPSIQHQAEDARIISYNNRFYLIYNDNREIIRPTSKHRRDMYIAEVAYIDHHFVVSSPIKIIYPEQVPKRLWEKNWVPFIWNNTFFLAYSIIPHEILLPDLTTGVCSSYDLTSFTNPQFDWKWGELRGGTPAMLVDGEYLAFFHSGIHMTIDAKKKTKRWYYFMGAYTFSSQPPFNLTKISRFPIVEKQFYALSQEPKSVIYPGGFVSSGNNIYLVYGKNDHQMWVAVINQEKLIHSLLEL